MARQRGDVLMTDDELMLYGHLSAQEFWEAAVRQGFYEDDEYATCPIALLHEWYRWVPAQPGDDYKLWGFPAKPHTRGAFPVTTDRY